MWRDNLDEKSGGNREFKAAAGSKFMIALRRELRKRLFVSVPFLMVAERQSASLIVARIGGDPVVRLQCPFLSQNRVRLLLYRPI
jgi:hypothetical protein